MDPLSIAQAETKISDFEATLKDGAKTEYEQKKKERIVLRRKVTMAINNVLDAISTDPYNNNQTKAYLRKLTEAAEKLEEGQFELELLITNEEAASLDAQLHQHRYGKKVVEAETAANNQISITARTTPDAAPKPASILLPKPQLPKFSGKSSADFESFINVFDAMVGQKSLTKAEKLTYLKLCLEGEAQTIANGYSEISDSNYDNLIQQLREKFGQPRLIQRDHFMPF